MLDDAPDTTTISGKPQSAATGRDRPGAPTASRPRKLPGRNQLLIGAGLSAFAIAAYMLGSWWFVGRFQVATDDAYVGVRAATLSPKVGGYVTEIAVADNALVKPGDLIARIDPGDYLLSVRAVRDQCATQRSTIDRIGQQIAGQQAVVAQMKAQAASAHAGAVRSELEFKRQTELAVRHVNSASALEQAQAGRDQGIAAVAAAEAAVASAAANVAVYEAQRVEAENTLKQNLTMLVKAERDLSFAEIRAPYEGVFANRAMQVGDYVQPAQRLASLVPLRSVYIDANFKETQLSRLKPGQPVSITVDALSGTKIEGWIDSVAPASGSVFSLLPPDNATGNFTKVVQRVPVRIAIPDETAARSILRPGMSVTVSVNTKADAKAPSAPVKTSSRIN